MNAATVLNFPEQDLLNTPSTALILMIMTLRAELQRVQTESSKTIADLQEKLAQRDAELEKITKDNINKTVVSSN